MRSKSTHHVALSALVVIGLVVMLPGTGCPPPPPPPPPVNNPPTANAGSDQTVAPGAAVTLIGIGTDPDVGNILSYLWTLIGGTNPTTVTLTGANTTTPGFTAPATTGTLVFQLVVNDGTANSLPDATTVTVSPPPPTTTPRLFVANWGGNRVSSWANPATTVNGNTAPDTKLFGAATTLNQPSDAAVDPSGASLACNDFTPSVTAYNNAATVTGNQAPDRNVQGGATQLAGPRGLAVNTTTNRVLVSDPGAGRIFAYDASTFFGAVAPAAVNSSSSLVKPEGIDFGAGDTLYVADRGANSVLVFDNASTWTSGAAASRTITSASFIGALFDVFVDDSDNLFVVDNGAGWIHIFNNASTRNGPELVTGSLIVTGAASVSGIAVDSSGNGYVSDFNNNAVYGYNNIAALNGAVAPHRTLSGASTLLNGPNGLFLQE